MRSTTDLSLEQAPPIDIPLRFFLTAPGFGALSGILMIAYGPGILAGRWSAPTLALTHFLTLGFLGLVMSGALMQMLPVAAGSPVPGVVWVGRSVHLLVTLGTLLLGLGFLLGGDHWLISAAILLGAGFTFLIVAVAIALKRVPTVSPTVTGMRLAITALLVTVILGVTLVAGMSGSLNLAHQLEITNVHLAWGLAGWVGLLVISVAYLVVPMFQVTPEYPNWIRRSLVSVLFAGIAIWSTAYWLAETGFVPSAVPQAVLVLVAGCYALFAGVTLNVQAKRRRRLSDVTLLYWRTAMFAIFACLLLGMAGFFLPSINVRPEYFLLIGIGWIIGFGVSVTAGMLYKILPFLAWFHLQHRQIAVMRIGEVKVPNMKELLPDRMARWQYRLHLFLLTALCIAVFRPSPFVYIAGLLCIASFGVLWFNLMHVALRFRDINRLLRS